MCNATRVTIPCLFCNGGLNFSMATGLYHCNQSTGHTMRHTDQQIAFWSNTDYPLSMPQPLPQGLPRAPLGRPCLFCEGDMIQCPERWHWMCNVNFKHRMYYWPEWSFAQWDESTFKATRFEKPEPWAWSWEADHVAAKK